MPDEMSLVNLLGGKAVARFNDELRAVLANINDPNTEAEAARKVTLVLSVKPDEERRNLSLNVTVTSKEAPDKVLVGFARCGVRADGVPVAVEDLSRQLPLFPPEERDHDKVIDMKRKGEEA